MSNKINFNDVAFIIPFQHSGNIKRVKGLTLVLFYLLKNFDCKIYLKETGGNVFEEEIIPFLKSMALDVEKIKYFNDPTHYEFFPKTKILNDLILATEEKYIVMNDSDILLPIVSYIKARKKLINGTDFVLPFSDDRNYYIGLNPEYFFESRKTIDLIYNINNNQNEFEKKFDSPRPGPPGGIHFLRKQSYIDGYMENENFSGYGPEDMEKIVRFKRLGFKFDRLPGYIFHISHDGDSNAYQLLNVGKNEFLFNQIISFSDKELIEYYERQEYFAERKKQLEKVKA